jgi:hypothetical protein
MFAPKVARPQTKAAESPTSKLAPQRLTVGGHRLGHDPVEQALFLQRTIGNQATLRLLAQRAAGPTTKKPGGDHEQGIAPENMVAQEAPRGVSWDFSARSQYFRLTGRRDLKRQHLRRPLCQASYRRSSRSDGSTILSSMRLTGLPTR